MPPRAPIGDRQKIEGELSPEGRYFLREECRLRAISRFAWQSDDDLNRLMTLNAIQSRAERSECDGTSSGIALREAAVYCGVDPESVERLLRRRSRARRADITSSPLGRARGYDGESVRNDDPTYPPARSRSS